VRIDREKERTQLKEQNRRLRIQLRDTAEAVHAAGELLVRLREAEEASTQEKVS
jgi:kinesin family member 15